MSKYRFELGVEEERRWHEDILGEEYCPDPEPKPKPKSRRKRHNDESKTWRWRCCYHVPRYGAQAPKRWAAIPPVDMPPFEAMQWRKALAPPNPRVTEMRGLRDMRDNVRDTKRQTLEVLETVPRDAPVIGKFSRIDPDAWVLSDDEHARACRLAQLDYAERLSNRAREWFGEGFGYQDIPATIEERREKYNRPLRERRKAGRKPLGKVAMSGAERIRKHRMKKLLAADTPTTGTKPHARADRRISRHAPGLLDRGNDHAEQARSYGRKLVTA